jgi:hypothetical protein
LKTYQDRQCPGSFETVNSREQVRGVIAWAILLSGNVSYITQKLTSCYLHHCQNLKTHTARLWLLAACNLGNKSQECPTRSPASWLVFPLWLGSSDL